MNVIQGTKPAWNNILTNVLQVHKYKQNHIDHAVFIYCSPNKTETQIPLSETLPAEPEELIQLEKQYGGPYQTTLGQFQHVKEWTRPKLSYAITRIGSFNVAPSKPAFQGLKHIARFLATHTDKPFFYPKNVLLDGTNTLRHQYDHATHDEITILNDLKCFQDAGLACDLTDRRSISACFHFLYGVAVPWKIGKQPAVAAHSTNAELRAMFLPVKRTITFRHFLEHLRYSQADPTRHHEGNQPSIDIVSANKVTSRVRHIHIPTFEPNPLQTPYFIVTSIGFGVSALAQISPTRINFLFSAISCPVELLRKTTSHS
eukprot:scaffold158076_cov30-Attheya_sp.AAC.1